MNGHTIRATYNDQTIRVYQAFNNLIADEAVQLGTFGHSFKLDRMTWIKPSFLWMMYRSGWATKEGQQRILAIDVDRDGFDSIVGSAVLTSYSEPIYGTYEKWKRRLKESNVRCQWDPERDIYGTPLDRRTIQLGIKGDVLKQYVSDWIYKISDITPLIVKWREEIATNTFNNSLLPLEREYINSIG